MTYNWVCLFKMSKNDNDSETVYLPWHLGQSCNKQVCEYLFHHHPRNLVKFRHCCNGRHFHIPFRCPCLLKYYYISFHRWGQLKAHPYWNLKSVHSTVKICAVECDGLINCKITWSFITLIYNMTLWQYFNDITYNDFTYNDNNYTLQFDTLYVWHYL